MPIGLHVIWRGTESNICQKYEDKTLLPSLYTYLLNDTTSDSSRHETESTTKDYGRWFLTDGIYSSIIQRCCYKCTAVFKEHAVMDDDKVRYGSNW